MVSKLKNLWKFFGGTNVDCVYNSKNGVVSKISRKNPMYYLLNIMIVAAILIFILLFVAFLFGKASAFQIFVSFILIDIFLLLYFLLRIKDGDTIVATEEGIKELNWLFSKYIEWSDVVKVYFYSGGKYLKNLPGLKALDWTWTNIKIKGHNQTIRVNTAYSNNEQLKEYIKMRCSGKIKEKGFNPLSLLIGLIVGILGAVFLLKIRELIK